MVVEPRAKSLQASQVIGQAELLAQPAEDGPIACAFGGAERLLQTVAEIRGKAIVVQEGIVHIQHENHPVGLQHGEVRSTTGSCQVSSPLTTSFAADGPHVPGSYSRTGWGSARTGSTTRHAASTQSS